MHINCFRNFDFLVGHTWFRFLHFLFHVKRVGPTYYFPSHTFCSLMLDWVNIAMCVSHLLPWVLSGHQSVQNNTEVFWLHQFISFVDCIDRHIILSEVSYMDYCSSLFPCTDTMWLLRHVLWMKIICQGQKFASIPH